MQGQEPSATPCLIDVDAAAERLNVTPRFVRRLVAERRIPYYKIGKFIRFDESELAVWLTNCRVSPIDQAA
ncbi:MAG: helix-turn-helix domain-containing protein [Actinomycetota bacterium]